MVRAKVTCEEFIGHKVKFHTVYEPDAATDTDIPRFTLATAFGTIEMAIDNPKAMEQFEVGKSYYVDFHPAESQ
jgi:hypothetical protein